MRVKGSDGVTNNLKISDSDFKDVRSQGNGGIIMIENLILSILDFDGNTFVNVFAEYKSGLIYGESSTDKVIKEISFTHNVINETTGS